MIVVSNTTPLIGLATIGRFELLCQLFATFPVWLNNDTPIPIWPGELVRILPSAGRWASVVFHNTDDRVWKAIQQPVQLTSGLEETSSEPQMALKLD